jgi:hypothetical protein
MQTATSTRTEGVTAIRDLQRLPLTGDREEEVLHGEMAPACSVTCIHIGIWTGCGS